MATSLFDIAVSPQSLNNAWRIVHAKNTAGGIDGVSITDYAVGVEKRLKVLQQQLITGKWSPCPYLNVDIPKNNGESRTIGLMSVDSKIVQTSIKNVIEPILERTFLSSSYAYRPGKGHIKCVRRALSECKAHRNGYYIRGDIDDFFQSIDRLRLIDRLGTVLPDKRLLSVIDIALSMGAVNDKLEWVQSQKGIPQGAILSPLLANFYVTPFDQSVLSRTQAYVRYSDDFAIWTNSEAEAEVLTTKVVDYLSDKLGLILNEAPEVEKCDKGMDFLGLNLSPDGITIPPDKMNELVQSISELQLDGENPSTLYWKTIDGIRRYYLSVLPGSFRVYFEQIFEGAVQNWKEKGKKVSANMVNQIKQRLLGPDESIRISSPEMTKDKLPKDLIHSRKLEFQRLEAENSELVIMGAGYFIGAGERGITVRKNGQPVKIRSSAVKHISIMSGGVGISSNLVEYCCKNGIVIDFFGEHSKHLASCLTPSFLQSSLWVEQSTMSTDRSFLLAKAIMTGKLKNQLSLCKYYNKYHKNKGIEDAFIEFKREFETVIVAMEESLPKEGYQKTMMAHEGHAAELYWGYIKILLDDDNVEFYSRVGQGATDVFNSMLNYGYGLLYPRIWQALLRYGMNPYAGIIHHAEGNPNLVFDFIEIFRSQAVDRVVISMVQKKEKCSVNKNGELDADTKQNLCSKIMKRLYGYEPFRGESRRFVDIIDIQARNLSEYFIAGKAFKPYLSKW